jgi:hypothetical protein
MDAAEAISLVTEWILWENLDYPTDGLAAERFEAGWTVSAPVGVDGRRPSFLVGDSGRIEQVSPSISLRDACAEFTGQELAAQSTDGGFDESQLMAELEEQFRRAESEDLSATGSLTIDNTPPEDRPPSGPATD